VKRHPSKGVSPIIGTLAVSLLLSSPNAEENSTATVEPSIPSATVTKGATSSSPAGKVTLTATGEIHGLQTPVTLDADDAYLPKVLAALAERSGFNVVAGPEVNKEQRISIHLKNTPVEEAINLVVRAAGLSYEIVGNSF
jgi:type II secretory pathway component HofQ